MTTIANVIMNGIQFVIDYNVRKLAVQMDLRKRGALWEDFRDGAVSETRRKRKGISPATVKAALINRVRLRG